MYPKQVICHFSTKKPFLQDFLFFIIFANSQKSEIIKIIKGKPHPMAVIFGSNIFYQLFPNF